MTDLKEISDMALELPGVTSKPHFTRTAFRNRTIFMTLEEGDPYVNLMFDRNLQDIYCKAASDVVSAIPNKWGDKGATRVLYSKAPKKLIREMLRASYDLHG